MIENLYRSFLLIIVDDGDTFIHDGVGLYRGLVVLQVLRKLRIRVIV